MTKFALIGASGTEHYRSMLPYQMCLAQYLAEDSAYRSWYMNAGRWGMFIIMDNGTPEGTRMPTTTLAAMAAAVNADEVIIPDAMKDARETLKLLIEETPHLGVSAHRRMFVPQGTNWDEWLWCLSTAHDTRIGFATIGVAKHLEALPGGRAHAYELIEKLGYSKHYHTHALGFYSNIIEECKAMREFKNVVRGVDSAAPFAYAQNNRLVTDAEHFSYEWGSAFDSRIAEFNIQLIMEALNGKTTCRPL